MMSTKTKILIPMFLLTAILIFIGGVVTFINYSKINSLKKLHENIIFSSKVSTVLHTLQRERGLSCGYVVNKNNKFKKELLRQRATSDIKIEKLKKNLHYIVSDSLQKDRESLLLKLSQLHDVRDAIDLYNISYDNVIHYYSNINTILLDILINISKDSHIPKVTQNLLAYSNLLYLKEYMGIERAEGVAIYSKKSIERKTLIEFSNILSLEKRSEVMFLKYASPDMKKFYTNILKNKSFVHGIFMQNIILYNNLKTAGIDSKEWFETVTQSLNSLDSVANYIEKETIYNIQKELHVLSNIFLFLTSLIIISLIVFILMLIAFFKLAREEQRLRIVIDKYIISSTTDLQGKIIDVSEAFCNISGYTRQELIGKPHNIVRHPDMSKELFRNMWFRISRGLSWSGKVKNKRKDGSFYWVYANVEPLFTTGGNVDSYISVRLDITESELLLLKIKEEEQKSKWQEEMIREQSRLVQMGEMISMIAHQWRQPLSAIAAASGSLQLKANRNRLDNDTAIEIANKIKEFSLHLSATIDDFRNFFKTNKTKTKTNFEEVLQNVFSIVDGSLEKNGIVLTTEVKNLKNFITFENELKQVILSLIKNAEDALVDNEIKMPQINIFIQGESFTIIDNAGGIHEDIIDKIFDPYFSTKRKKDGTGLGLYMSKMIIEDHCNGKLTVSNEKNGAKFQITLGEKND